MPLCSKILIVARSCGTVFHSIFFRQTLLSPPAKQPCGEWERASIYIYIYPRNLSFVLTAISLSLSLRTFGFCRTSSSFFVAAASYGCALRKSDLSKMICGGVIREHNGLMKRESYSGGERGRDSAGCILAGYWIIRAWIIDFFLTRSLAYKIWRLWLNRDHMKWW